MFRGFSLAHLNTRGILWAREHPLHSSSCLIAHPSEIEWDSSALLWELHLVALDPWVSMDFSLLLGVFWHPRYLGAAEVLSSWLEIVSSLTNCFVRGSWELRLPCGRLQLAILVDCSWHGGFLSCEWMCGTRWGFGFGLSISSWSIKWVYRHNED